MSQDFEIYARYIGAYEANDSYAEERLVKAGFVRLRNKGTGDHFWLDGTHSAKGDLKKELDTCKDEKQKQIAALSWTQRHSHAGQIAIVREMWGMGPG